MSTEPVSHSPSKQGQRPEKIHALTSLRFFAAFYVVCFHSLWNGTFLPSLHRNSYLGKLIHLGYSQVSFFFLLSGYILAFVYLRDNRPIAARKFFLARFARIYPLLFLALLADTPHPTDRQIDNAMAGNLCRCATYYRIRAGIHRAAEIGAGREAAR